MSKEKEANIGNPRNFSYFFTTLVVVRVYEKKREREKNSYHCLVAAFFVNVFLKKLKKSSLKRAETTITCKTMHKMDFFHSLHSKFVRMSDFVQGRAKFAIKIESKRRKRNTEDQKNTAHTEKKRKKTYNHLIFCDVRVLYDFPQNHEIRLPHGQIYFNRSGILLLFSSSSIPLLFTLFSVSNAALIFKNTRVDQSAIHSIQISRSFRRSL